MIDEPVFFPSYYKSVMCTGGNKVALIAVSVAYLKQEGIAKTVTSLLIIPSVLGKVIFI